MGQVCQRRSVAPTASRAAQEASQSGKPAADAAEGSSGESISDPVDPAASAETLKASGNSFFKRQEFKQAVAAYGAAIALQPDQPAFWLNRALAHAQLHQWEEAERDAAKAATLQPENVKAHYNRGLALQQLGKLDDAVEACSAGLAVESDNKALQALEKSLKEDQRAFSEGKPLPSQKIPRVVEKVTKKAPSEQPAAAPKVPAAKVPEGVSKTKKYDVDYSRWSKFEDSDDENETCAGIGNVTGEVFPPLKDPSGVQWEGRNPSIEERYHVVEEMMMACRQSIIDEGKELGFGKRSSSPSAKKLPSDYQKEVGVIPLKQLTKYSCSNERMLVSVYGDIYDVSNCPAEYGYGPKSHHCGKDVTWCVITGKETAANCNRFYDIFKLDQEHLGRYLQIICRRLVNMEDSFGDAVGRLEEYNHERDWPPAPKEEIDECNQQ